MWATNLLANISQSEQLLIHGVWRAPSTVTFRKLDCSKYTLHNIKNDGTSNNRLHHSSISFVHRVPLDLLPSISRILLLPFFPSAIVFMTACPDHSFLRTRLSTSVPMCPLPVPLSLILLLCSESWSTQYINTIICCVDVNIGAEAVKCYVPDTVSGTRDAKNKADLSLPKGSLYLEHIAAAEHQSRSLTSSGPWLSLLCQENSFSTFNTQHIFLSSP